MARLAIIVPYIGDISALEDTLASILANRPADCEVSVVLLRPYDDPYDVRGEVTFIPADPGEGVVAGLNRAIRWTPAPVVHLVRCGVEVEEGWADAALTRLRDPRIAALAPLVLDQTQPGRILAAGVSYHIGGSIVGLAAGEPVDSAGLRYKRVLAPHPAAAFYRKSTLESLGGFDPRIGGQLAVVDVGLALEQSRQMTVFEPACRVHASPRAIEHVSAFRQALHAELLFWRWAARFGWSRSLTAHALTLMGESARGMINLSCLPRAAGRLAGVWLAVCRKSRADRQAAVSPLSATPSVPTSKAA